MRVIGRCGVACYSHLCFNQHKRFNFSCKYSFNVNNPRLSQKVMSASEMCMVETSLPWKFTNAVSSKFWGFLASQHVSNAQSNQSLLCA